LLPSAIGYFCCLLLLVAAPVVDCKLPPSLFIV